MPVVYCAFHKPIRRFRRLIKEFHHKGTKTQSGLSPDLPLRGDSGLGQIVQVAGLLGEARQPLNGLDQYLRSVRALARRLVGRQKL